MSHSYASDPNTIPDEGDSSIDLSTIFKHPAGLRTARLIIGDIIRATTDRRSSTTQTFSSVIPQIFGTSVESADKLRDLLAFSDDMQNSGGDRELFAGNSQTTSRFSESQSSYEQTLPSTQSSFSVPDITQPYSRNMHSTSNREPGASQHSGTYQNLHTMSALGDSTSLSASRPQISQYHSSAMDLDRFGGVTLARTSSQGTDSPFHVESPSGRTSFTPTSSQERGENGFGLPNPEFDPFQLDRRSPLSHSAHRQPARQRLLQPYHPGSASSHQMPAQPATARSTLSTNTTITTPPTTTIKGFLAVNKSDTNHNSMTAKNHSLSYPTPLHSTSQYHSPSERGVVAQPSPLNQQSLPIERMAPHQIISQTSNIQRATTQQTSGERPSPPSISMNTVNQPFRNIIPASQTSSSLGFALVDMVRSTSSTSTSSKTSKKRKCNEDGTPITRKRKSNEGAKATTKKRSKKAEAEANGHKLNPDLWIRIFEYSNPSFLKKARLVCKEWKGILDNLDGIYQNQRHENYGFDMPPAPKGISERQYNDLLDGQGCLEPGCKDKKSSRTHWSWAQRWCASCWLSKIKREDHVLKQYQGEMGRNILTELLQCIPVGMHDSFSKPHDFITDLDARPRGAPRIYKHFLITDVDKIIKEYNALHPVMPVVENPEERAIAQQKYQEEMAGLADKRKAFLDEHKAKNKIHMDMVQKIEAGKALKREEVREPHDRARNARKIFFTKRAIEDLPDIPTDFVQGCKPYKAATRIFRDAGSERGWSILKPKIEVEWEKHQAKLASNPPAASSSATENAAAAISDAANADTSSESGSSRAATPNIPNAQQRQIQPAARRVVSSFPQMVAPGAHNGGLPRPSAFHSGGLSAFAGMLPFNNLQASYSTGMSYGNIVSNMNTMSTMSYASNIPQGFAQSSNPALARATAHLTASMQSAPASHTPSRPMAISSLLNNNNNNNTNTAPPPRSNQYNQRM